MEPVRVWIVDDSALSRQVLTTLIGQHPRLQVAGQSADPLLAMAAMVASWPDVIVCDIEMPRMDGITFLKHLMRERPTPVVICSTLIEARAAVNVSALAAGATAVVPKPVAGAGGLRMLRCPELIRAIEVAAQARPAMPPRTLSLPPGRQAASRGRARLIAIGASTGGTQAIESVLRVLPAGLPPLLIVQHMPEKFTAAFATRLNDTAALTVREAQDGEPALAGHAYIAPGGRHLQLVSRDSGWQLQVRPGPPVMRHCPSVDALFHSCARAAGARAMGVLLTGMGEDGAAGLLAMRAAGAQTIAQDEESCIVFGMPREAIRRGAAARVLPLQAIAAAIRDGVA